MAVAVDAAGSGTTGTGGATSFTWAHTVSGSSRVLVVFFGSQTSATDPTSVTYGGVALTQHGSTAASSGATNDEKIQVWRLVAPVVGTANIVVSFATAQAASAGSLSLTGVDQSTPMGTAVTTTGGSSTSGSVTVTSAATGLVVSALGAAASVAPTATGTSQTVDGSATSGLSTPRYTAFSHQPGAASVTPAWSWNTANGFVIVGLNVYAVGTAPGVAVKRPSITLVGGAVRRASVI